MYGSAGILRDNYYEGEVESGNEVGKQWVQLNGQIRLDRLEGVYRKGLFWDLT